MKKSYLITFLLIVVAYLLGHHFGIGNQTANYGDTGQPKNCRALITQNLMGVELGHFTAEEALYSIERNCGSAGYIWNER